jgi:hypothetical protein
MSGRRQWADDSTVLLRLSDGASVTLSFRGNLFDLQPGERKLISDLTDLIQKYQDSAATPAEVNGEGR